MVEAHPHPARVTEKDASSYCSPQCCNHERQLATVSHSYQPYYDPHTWIRHYEDVARANNWSAKTKLDILPYYLHKDSVARTWFDENQNVWATVMASYDIVVGDSNNNNNNNNNSNNEDNVRFEAFKQAFVGRFEKDKERGAVWSRVVVSAETSTGLRNTIEFCFFTAILAYMYFW